ncbi:hypothetical protein CFO_g3490 [Ceratocystis platani]|uniref:Uncharacterized protein n=1 Tax=Ceratocystis fimbriata f. sp. platani TaxID=88771 RepID=A0A0F8CTU2_CERFI|nr:hypothetical protein CFO_g3490 [Ceratocystis platani]
MSGKNKLAKMREKEAEYMRNHAERQAQGSSAFETPPPYTDLASESTSSLVFSEASSFGVRSSSLPPAPALVPPPSPGFTHFPPPSPYTNHIFPSTFGVYESILSRTRTIGPHRNEPVLCIREHMRVKSGFDLVLHNGPDTSFEPLAGLTQKFFKRGFGISMPSSAAVLQPTQAGTRTFVPGSLDITEQVEPAAPSIRGRRLEFTIEVGRVRETFQWRERKGPGYSFRCRRHYVLLRRAADRPPDGAPPGSWPPAVQDDPESERDNTSGVLRESEYEDMEVVAQWDTEAIRGTKLTTFKFVGTGATGLLGPRWEVIAVLSGLHICIMEVDQSVAGTA